MHQQRLGHRLQFDRAAEIHVKFTGEQRLRRRVGERRTGGEALGERAGGVGELLVRDDLGGEADLVREVARVLEAIERTRRTP